MGKRAVIFGIDSVREQVVVGAERGPGKRMRRDAGRVVDMMMF